MAMRHVLAMGVAVGVLLGAQMPAAHAQKTPLVEAVGVSVSVNGVSTTPSGRVFMVPTQLDGGGKLRLAELKNGELWAYPNAAWNAWKPGMQTPHGFVRINSQRIGPDGALWAVDVGSPSMGAKIVPGMARLIRIDLKSNNVDRIYKLDDAIQPDSFVDDVRFNGRIAYLTDAGVPGLIVLNLDSGQARRVLNGDPSTTAQRPLVAEGQVLHGPDGKPVFVHADQLEVSPDGKYLYFQPASGPMSRVETRYLNDASLSDADLAAHVEKFADTQATGGTAIDAAGNIYASDVDHLKIMKIGPDGRMTTLLHDPRLLWVDAMWVDASGRLWMPAAQIDRLPAFEGSDAKVRKPFEIFTFQINQPPPANDHP